MAGSWAKGRRAEKKVPIAKQAAIGTYEAKGMCGGYFIVAGSMPAAFNALL